MFHPARQLQNSIRKSVCGSAVATVASYLRKKPSYVIVKNVVPAMYVRWLAATRIHTRPIYQRACPAGPQRSRETLGLQSNVRSQGGGRVPQKYLSMATMQELWTTLPET